MNSDTPESDDDELELEPIDPEILEHERRRGLEKARAAEDEFDINSAYESVEAGDPINLDDLTRFRFTMRHLLILTAVLAIGIALFQRLGACQGLFVSGSIALASGWWFVLREQRRKLEAIERRSAQIAARVARQRAIEDGQPVEPIDAEEFEDVNETWDATQEQTGFEFSFTTKQILATIAGAGATLALMHLVGSVESVALLLGMIALLGLVVHALGFQPAPIATFAWWVLLVLYILLGIGSAIGGGGSDEATASLRVDPRVDVRLQHVERHTATPQHHVVKRAHVESFA